MFGHHKKTLMGWLIISALAAGATSFPALWSMDTELVRQGEWWRLISGQLVHLTWQHYIYDLLALGLTICLCRKITSGYQELLLAAFCSSFAVSMTIQILLPVDVYGGLSGLTAGLLAWSSLMLTRLGSQVAGSVLLAGMLLKICAEWTGSSVSGVDVVWQAHCAGALAGVLSGLGFNSPSLLVRTYRKSRCAP